MQIVIDIDGGLYEWVHRQLGADEGWSMVQDAIMSGKVLPKGHGRLIDTDALLEQLDDAEKNMPVDHFEGLETAKVVVKSDTPTIIEADRSEE